MKIGIEADPHEVEKTTRDLGEHMKVIIGEYRIQGRGNAELWADCSGDSV